MPACSKSRSVPSRPCSRQKKKSLCDQARGWTTNTQPGGFPGCLIHYFPGRSPRVVLELDLANLLIFGFTDRDSFQLGFKQIALAGLDAATAIGSIDDDVALPYVGGQR